MPAACMIYIDLATVLQKSLSDEYAYKVSVKCTLYPDTLRITDSLKNYLRCGIYALLNEK